MSLHRLQEAAKLLLTGEPKDLGFHLDFLKAALETSLSPEAKEEVQRLVEDRWKERAKAQGLGKPSSAKYKRVEIEFFCGAMTALHALMPDKGEDRLSSFVPVGWVVNPMTGRNVVEVA